MIKAMEMEGKTTMKEAENSERVAIETSSPTGNGGNRFKHKLVQKLSIVQIVVGTISVIIGVVVVLLAIRVDCPTNCFDSPISVIGVGTWCGLMFIVLGVVGSCAAKKQSRCLIIAMLAFGIFAIVFAGAQIGFGVISALIDRNKFVITLNETDNKGRFVQQIIRTIPVPLVSLNVILAVLGVVMTGLIIASSVLSCLALCCLPRSDYPNANMVGVVSTSGTMQIVPQAYIASGGQMYYVPQGYSGGTQATMQPMVMMPMNPQAPVQYQVVGQPCPPPQDTPPAYQPNPDTKDSA